jgi:uncharacterized protein (TIGR03435 family)
MRLATLLSTLLIVAPAFAQFEVASIKLATFPNDSYFAGYADAAGNCSASIAEIRGNRVAFRRATLCGLIRFAYDVHAYQVVQMPAWMTKTEQSIFYDIETVVAGGTPSRDQVRPMLQALLADRFQLQTHREPREVPVYALVVDRNGPRLREGTPSRCQAKQGTTIIGGFGLFVSCGPTTSMAQLAQTLSRETDRAVVDRTGLGGGFAFTLEWMPDNAPARPDFPLPSIFTAVREQLGLRLEPQRAPVEAIVVDRAERPSPN